MSAIEDTQDRPIQSQGAESDPLLAEFERLKRDIVEAERARGDWRKEADQCYDFVAGHQWSTDDKSELEKQHRPAIVFNRTAPLLKAVCGLEVNNRQSIAYLPRQEGSDGINEMITSAGRWIRDECGAEDEESEAFKDLATCGEGWTEMRMDFDEDPQGQIVEERLDPREMGVNKGSVRRNYLDARMVYRIRTMDPDDVRALLDLPQELNDDALDASKWLEKAATPADGGPAPKKDYPSTTPARVRRGGSNRLKTVTVVQCQYWRREPVNIVATANDQEPQHMTNEEFASFQDRADQMEQAGAPLDYQVARTRKKVYYQCFIGMKILDSQPMQMGMFQFKAMTGERDSKKKCFYGMVRDMLDPQMWSNKWLSQSLHIMNSNAKGGLIAETDAFINVKKAEKEWSDPTKITWVKPGSIAKSKIKEKQISQLPAGFDQLMMFAISSIRDVTGINLELLGQADREQAASLEQQRRQSAMTILATMFDNLRRYRKLNGKLMLHFIWLLPDNTLIRVLDQGQYKYIPLVKQGLEIEKFDIIIDQAPSSPDQKQFIWSLTAQILQMGILPAPAIIALLKYSPYPESVVAEIRAALGVDGKMPPEELQKRLDQAEQALQFCEEKLKEAMAAADSKDKQEEMEMYRVKIDEYKAQTDRLNAEWQARVKLATAVVSKAGGPAPAGEGGISAAPPVGDISFEQLPDIGGVGGDLGGGAAGGPNVLEQKVDALAGMMQQLIQTLNPQQQPEPVPPPAGPSAEPSGIEG